MRALLWQPGPMTKIEYLAAQLRIVLSSLPEAEARRRLAELERRSRVDKPS